MQTTEERLAAIKKRASEIEKQRSRRRSHFILASALAVSLLVILGLSFYIPSLLAASSDTNYTRPGETASIFDGSPYLGCILIGILAFMLGVAITILSYRIKARHQKEKDTHGRAPR